ncbi:hypothetical protein [Flagellimonas sp.]|uniref:hypothetical protein n=1 Tax=Flagellimonas sp. TaxID=2058762 RepID=UPI003B5A4A67
MKSKRNKNPVPIIILGIALLASIIYIDYNRRQKKKAEQVYQETKKAMGLLAVNLDKGIQKIAHLQQFQITVQKIYNH